MQEGGKATHYFLSANTPLGLIGRSEQLYDASEGWKAYILKGGPGKGKSGLIEKVGRSVLETGTDAEYIHSTIDTASLDGVVVPSLKICVLDGSSPQAIEPKYPGAVESIVSLGDCWNEKKLSAEQDKIIHFAARIHSFYDRAYRFLSAAASLQNDTYRLVLDCTGTGKIDRYALRIAKREFTPKHRQGRESVRFLSAITPDGLVCFQETAVSRNRVYVIEDDYGLGRLLLGKLRTYALSAGYDVTGCYCPMSPDEKLEHLVIPSLSLAFVTSNRYHVFEGKGFRHIHIRRFVDAEAVRGHRQRILFNRKSSRELIGESVKLLSDAKANYDILNDIYASSMDFDAVDRRAAQLIAKILQK